MIQAGAISTSSQRALLVAAEDWISSKADRNKRLSLAVEFLKNCWRRRVDVIKSPKPLASAIPLKGAPLDDDRFNKSASSNRPAERFVMR